MASIRELGACLGLPGTFTILGDFFGYASAPPWLTAPSQKHLPASLSVLEQVRRIQQPYFNLYLVRVGVNPGDLFLEPEEEENVDCAVQLTRDIYAQIGVGIGRVDRWWYIPYGSKYDVIDDDCEADELIDAYDLPDDGIKVFFVTAWLGNTVGRTDGDKDGSAVLLRSRGPGSTFILAARTLAHEMGHMFGLGHQNDDASNLMCQGGHVTELSNLKTADFIPAATHFYDWQGDDVREDEDWLRGPC